MKTRLFQVLMLIGLIALLGACNNPLWYGGGGEGSLNLQLELPGLPGTDSLSRALAFQGKYLYVEIAEILNETNYSDNNAFYSLDSGNGDWTETSWGAHAVVHRDYTNTSTVTVNFFGVPSDRNLLLRVVQSISLDEMVNNDLPWYPGDGVPLAQTYDVDRDGIGPWSDMGLLLSPSMLASGTIRIPIRPHPLYNVGSPLLVDGASFPANSMLLGDTGVPYRSDNVGPTLPGQSEFSDVSLDMSNGGANEAPGMFVGIHVNAPDTSPMPGRLDLYKQDGTRIALTGGRDVPDVQIPGNLDRYRYYIVKANLDVPNGANNDFFMGVTIFDNMDVSLNTLDYDQFDLESGVLTQTGVYSQYSGYNGTTVVFHTVFWEFPYPIGNYNRPGDMEFQVLHFTPGNLPSGNLLNYDIMIGQSPSILLNWGSAVSYFVDDGEVIQYTIPDIQAILGNIIAAEGDQFTTVIAARLPGGEPFIIGTDSGNYTQG